ncbi:MAG TPA: aldose 1-epimerase [Steroidobacteraceae bacterium]|nr:aldose 1-epimerase [Steroidobacteraceae bacterium]
MKAEVGLLTLQHHATRLTLNPRRGGSIHELRWQGRDLLRPSPAGVGDDPIDTACFPMVPFANRVANGRFSYGNERVQLPRNWSGDPHPLHGQGWRLPWSVAAADASRAILRFEGGGDAWPWVYRCEQRFLVLPDGVQIELSIENLSATPMPAMLGLHPYFPDSGHATVEARLPRVWLTDSSLLPLSEVPTPDSWSFARSRPVAGPALDHGFTGWDGRATLRWPDRTLTLDAPDCRVLHVYVPKGKDFFCIEPQTAAPGALSRGEADEVLPGQRVGIRVTLRAEAA